MSRRRATLRPPSPPPPWDQHVVTFRGPLPATGTFTTESTGPATLFVAGSCWTQTRDSLIGISVSLDGQRLGDATVWSIGPTTHRAVVPATFGVTLDQQPGVPNGPPPTYIITLAPLDAGTLTDLNDNFSVVLSI